MAYGAGPYGRGIYPGIVPPPPPTITLSGPGTFGCRLSLSSTDPSPNADITGSTVYLLPTKQGPYVAYVSAAGVITWAAPASPPSLSLSGLAANSIHDLYLIDQSGSPVLARVSGLGTDTIKFGFRLNASGVTGYLSNGSAVTIGQYKGLYIGSILISPADGIVRCDVSFDQNRQWGVWNYFNQERITLRAGEPVRYYQGHLQTNTNWAPLAANTGNNVTVFSGRPVAAEVLYSQATYRLIGTGSNAIGFCGIGWNCTNDATGTLGQWDTETAMGGNIANGATSVALKHVPDSCGANVATMLVKMVGGTGSVTGGSSVALMAFGNTEADHVLKAQYLG